MLTNNLGWSLRNHSFCKKIYKGKRNSIDMMTKMRQLFYQKRNEMKQNYPTLKCQCLIFTVQQETLFAVKTCSKFHDDRLPVLKATWAEVTSDIVYVSDKEDPIHETIVLPGAEMNVTRGFCRKTESILKYFSEQNRWRWIVIVDDDTVVTLLEKKIEVIN